MDRNLYDIFGPNEAIQSQIDLSYEFSHLATYGNDVPHTVVFVNDTSLLKIPVSRFQVGDYEEWKDQSVLSTREVARAAAELSIRR